MRPDLVSKGTEAVLSPAEAPQGQLNIFPANRPIPPQDPPGRYFLPQQRAQIISPISPI